MSDTTIVSTDSPVCFVGGGVIGNRPLGADLASDTRFVGVDSGADHLLAAGVSPMIVIGDLDSLSDSARAAVGAVLHHGAEQDTTDFEKALMRVDAPLITALGFTGGRIDHILGVLNVMARYPQKRVLLADDEDVSFVMTARLERLELPEDTRISLMPLDDVVVTATGLRWSLNGFAMRPTGRTSGSNVTTGTPIAIQTTGPILVTLPRAFLAVAAQAAVRAE